MTSGRADAPRPPGSHGASTARPSIPAVEIALPATGNGPAAGPTRLVRAVVAGGSSVSLAVGAHTAASGQPPPAWLVLAAGALFVRLAWGLARRRRGLAAVLGLLTCSQLAAHVAFVLASHPVGAGHHHVLRPTELLLEQDGSTWTRAAFMVLAHLAALLGTGLLLHRADRLLWAAATLRTALPRAAARIVGPLVAAAARLRRLMVLAATDGDADGRLDVGSLASRPPVRPRTHPVGRAARRRGPPASPVVTLLVV
ncbi:hypothetical protein [Pseudofrankia sp. DC12]|uniref:hypothetical protein n=1 Tax=Pseudofrankia sp. DC12 TaxID=683315 RepID=UPI000698C575|nr:hypothetical protein [Pseudofrankia sp. DC12]